MVTSESNRVQSPAATPFDRPTQAYQPPAESVAQELRAQQRESISVSDPFWFLSYVVAGATIGSVGGLSALVLSILGLSAVTPVYILPTAGIVLGLALVMLGIIDAAWARMFRFAEHETPRERIIFFSGLAAALIAGVAAAILGILNVTFPADVRFSAGAVIVLGLGLLWHSGVMRRVSQFTHDVTYRGAEGMRPSGPFAVNALSLAPLRDFLLGLGGTILGILAILNIAPVVLALVALLAMGGGVALTASTICGATLTSLKSACSKS